MYRYLKTDTCGKLMVKDCCLSDLVKTYGSPLFVFFEWRMVENIKNIERAYKKYFKKFKLFYATKACSNSNILEIIKNTGVGVEINSGGELLKVIAAGFAPEDIVFNGVAKSVKELEDAVNYEIHSINVDSISELLRIIETSKKTKKKANISLRIVPEVMGGTVAGFETGHVNSKFGLMPSDLDIIAPIILENRMFVNYIGFHYHAGSQVINPDAFTSALSNILNIENKFFKNTGLKSSCINMGGGFPIPLAPYNSMPVHANGDSLPLEIQKIISAELTIEHVAKLVASTWDNAYTNLNKNETFVQIEPGRRVIGDAGILLATVEHLKKRPNGLEWLMLDVGFNILPEILFYDWYYHVVSASRFGEVHDKCFRLAGPLCDTGDSFHDERTGTKLPDSRLLPTNTQQKDILAILNAGAYAIEQQSNYNGRAKAAAVIVRTSGDIQLVGS